MKCHMLAQSEWWWSRGVGGGLSCKVKKLFSAFVSSTITHHPVCFILLGLAISIYVTMLLFQLLFWLLFDICANLVSKITDTISFSKIKIIHHTAQVCHIFIWLFSHHKMFQATVQQAASTKSCVPYDSRKDIRLIISVW